MVVERLNLGSIQPVHEAVDLVVVELGLILAALGAAAPPVPALFNLSDDALEEPIQAESGYTFAVRRSDVCDMYLTFSHAILVQ